MSASHGSDRLSGRSLALMATLCVAQVLEVLGVTVVIVALPAIGDDLGFSASSLQLVVSLYAVVYGGLLLTSGRIADLFDRRRVFAGGLAVTLLGAVACAVAPSSAALLAGRALHGLGGALVTPAALALLSSSFAHGRARRIAMSAWTAAAAGGGALGFVAGGLLVDAVGWRGVFWLLVPVAAAVLAAVPRLVPPQPRAVAHPGLDLPGSLAATVGLVLLVWGAGLVEHPAAAPVPPIVVLVLGGASLVAFVVIERHGRAPLIAWKELTNRAFMTANGAAFINTATTSASGTLVALFAQRVLGLDARGTGLVLLPFSLAVVAGSTTGSRWLQRRPAIGMAAGLAVVAVAMLALATATTTSSAAGLAAAVAVAGLGLSWAAVTSTSAATQALPEDRQGVASGAVNTAAQIGTALGVAVLLALAASIGTDGQRTGYTAAFIAAAALATAYTTLLVLHDKRSARTGLQPRNELEASH